MIYSGKGMYKLLKNPKNKEVKLVADPLKDHCSYGEITLIGLEQL